MLTLELARLKKVANRSGAEWESAARRANVWLARSAALDGQRGLAAATPTSSADVAISWGAAMGVHYPVDTSLTFPTKAVRQGSSALSFAITAHRRGLEAGAKHAAAIRAVDLITDQLHRTRVRQRAIDRRWIPRLQEALADLEARVDEADREENMRMTIAGGGRAY